MVDLSIEKSARAAHGLPGSDLRPPRKSWRKWTPWRSEFANAMGIHGIWGTFTIHEAPLKNHYHYTIIIVVNSV